MKLKILNHCGNPYLARLELLNLLGWSLKLHIFIRGDIDEELHDHPWSFWTLVLCGGYWEEIPVDQAGKLRGLHAFGRRDERVLLGGDGKTCFERRYAGSLCFRPAEWQHRVILNGSAEDSRQPGPCATLVLTAPPSREWGFWRKLATCWKFIPWRELVDDRRNPC